MEKSTMGIWIVDCDKCGAIRIVGETDLTQDDSIEIMYPEIEKVLTCTCRCGNVNKMVYNPVDNTLRNWRGNQHYKQLSK